MSDLIPVEESRADFFVTGNEYIRDSLDLKFIPHANLCKDDNWGGVFLTADNQDLNQSYLSAKKFFEQAPSKSIKFVLIGLSPYIVSANDKEPLVICAVDEKILYDYFKLCLDNGAKPVVVSLPVNAAVKKTYTADAVKTFRDTINQVRKKINWKAKFVDLLDIGLPSKLFQDKTHLNAEGKAAVTALLSERLYFVDIISTMEICGARKEFFNVLGKYFAHQWHFWSDDIPLPHYIFAKMAYEDFNRLSKIMPRETCMDLMVNVFCELTYSYLACLVEMLPKDDYNELTTRLFNMTEEKIRRQDKIKVGFYFEYSSHWCGDNLYNLLAQDERFEPTIFVPIDKSNEFNRDEFLSDAKKFKARGFNVFEMKSASLNVPKQNIIFRFYPYPEWVSSPTFRLANIKIKETLLANIPYSFTVIVESSEFINHHHFHVLWKKFFPSTVLLKKHKEVDKLGMPRGVYSGYPKMDIFFKPDSKFHFDWKMTRLNAKKIIWAPHWLGSVQATFQWNYQFMYEFAKAHHEISWIVKPHSQLFQNWSGFFLSNEALREYFQKWDDLPNAKVYVGTYYQDIFATSDGMIHDSCSFTAEYQYVDKPMIYLTRTGRTFDELGKAILNASYLVDGKDLDGIAAMIQRVFIEGDDYKAAARKEVFDKYLNYPKDNGMLASEFIYKNIVDELKLPPR